MEAKLFTGKCIYKDDFTAALAPTRYDPATLVVVAAPKEIDREWRLVVAEGQVIAASQYAVKGSKCIEPGCPATVWGFAETMLAEVRWRPDPIFMLDICAAEERFWLVEINGFSCSWLYQCDLAAVVAEASRLAVEGMEASDKGRDDNLIGGDRKKVSDPAIFPAGSWFGRNAVVRV